jgi:hypothetical protein
MFYHMFSEWVLSIVLIILFSIFPMIDAITGGMDTIRANWSLYRCNPIMLPFASYFAPKGTIITSEENFSYCTQSMMANFTPNLMQPFAYLQSMTTDMMGSINNSLSSSNTQFSFFKFGVSGIIETLYNVFINVIIQFNILTIKMSDTQGKITGIVSTIMYVMTVVQYTFESMWNGVPGAMIKALNKKPGDLIKMPGKK